MIPANYPDQAAEELIALATNRFGDLNEAETKLLRAVVGGDIASCGPNQAINNSPEDASKDEEWVPKCEVRADRIYWLCTNLAAVEKVDSRGIKLFGALVTGTLDLSYVKVPFPLSLLHCCVPQEINLASAQLPALYLNGSRTGPIVGDGLTVKGGLFLRTGFIAQGEVRLLGARIGGNLDCSGGSFNNPPQKAGSADHRFCGPRLFGALMERSNSCARVAGHSQAVDDQTVRQLTDSPPLVPAYSL